MRSNVRRVHLTESIVEKHWVSTPTLEALEFAAGILVSDVYGNVREANDEYLHMIGVTREEFEKRGARWDRVTTPEHLILDHEAVQRALATGRSNPYEKVYILPDGTRVPVLLVLHTLSAKENTFVVIVIDLSEVRKTEDAVQVALKASRTGTWDWNIVTGESIWSAETREFFGLRPADPTPTVGGFLQRVHPEDRERVGANLKESLDKQKLYRVHYRVEQPDGSTRWLLSTGFAFKSHQGKPVRMSGVVVDITELKTTEIKLRESQEELRRALRLREEFISLASHELATPLTAIKLHAEILDRMRTRGGLSAVDSKLLESFLDLTLHQCRRLNRLIGDLLDTSRLIKSRLSLKPVRAKLAALIRSALASVSEQLRLSGSSLQLEMDESIEGTFDPLRLEQVLENLFTNAIKYGQGAPVHVSLIRIGEDRARIQVRDQGLGIEPELQEKIFERFERGNADISFAGLGLGLYISKEIVESHGGTIRVESVPGKGSVFTLELPLSRA